MNGKQFDPNFKYVDKSITDLVHNRNILDNETILALYRELECLSRLLCIEIFHSSSREEEIKHLALHQCVNYLQTPESQYGLLPPVEVSMKLSCYMKPAGPLFSQAELDGLMEELDSLDDLEV